MIEIVHLLEAIAAGVWFTGVAVWIHVLRNA